MSCNAMQCNAMQCNVMLWYVMLCYAMLCHVCVYVNTFKLCFLRTAEQFSSGGGPAGAHHWHRRGQHCRGARILLCWGIDKSMVKVSIHSGGQWSMMAEIDIIIYYHI